MSDNTSDTNPYLKSSAKDKKETYKGGPIPKIVGVISILFGTYHMIFSALAIASLFLMYQPIYDYKREMLSLTYSYFVIVTLVFIIMAIWAIVIGIRLIKQHDSGRRQLIYYTVLLIILTLISSAYGLYIGDLRASPWRSFFHPIVYIVSAFLLNKKDIKETLIR